MQKLFNHLESVFQSGPLSIFSKLVAVMNELVFVGIAHCVANVLVPV
jgi:hypothetical protein